MKQTGGVELDWLALDRSSSSSLFHQLTTALREAVLTGKLPAGIRLPATRALAAALQVSRNTVSNAYEQLVAEGYLLSRSGSGTRVVQTLPDALLSTHRVVTPVNTEAASRPVANPAQKLLYPNLPAIDEFPVELWRRLHSRILRSYNPEVWMNYGDIAGYLPLRQSIAEYLSAGRGLNCHTGQILIVNGSQQALDLIARTLLTSDDTLLIENPCYRGALGVFRRSGAKLHAVDIDHDGMKVEHAIAAAPDARMAFVTPSHQFPMGSVLSLSRRLQLLEWAASRNAWIIEDDYGGEYRYSGRPLMALQGLDQHQRVIYTGTFSKVLYPAMRLGYVVLPEALVEKFTVAKKLTDSFPALLPQLVMQEFISGGHFSSHIRKMRNLYATRHTCLMQALQSLAPLLNTVPSESGMHITSLLSSGMEDGDVTNALAEKAIHPSRLSKHYVNEHISQGLIFGFANSTEAGITRGVEHIKDVLMRFS